ncbi:Phosphoglycolate phosphatase [uncultured archaeon]|nr:Phosphoglycolate phosphatase [uncultured archaeon]
MRKQYPGERMINLRIRDKSFKDMDLLIFDKDGTLFELYPYWSKVALKRAELISKSLGIRDDSLISWITSAMGADLKNKKMNPKGPIGIYNRSYIQELLYNGLEKEGYPIERDMISEAFKETDEYINQDWVLKSALVPVKGLMEFLSKIEDRCKCAICSYDQTGNLKHIAEMFDISDNFDLFLGGDLIKYPKPEPWGALKIMAELNVSPANTVFLGDSIFDIECGKNAQCKYQIAVISDISDAKSLMMRSDATIRDYDEIDLD